MPASTRPMARFHGVTAATLSGRRSGTLACNAASKAFPFRKPQPSLGTLITSRQFPQLPFQPV